MCPVEIMIGIVKRGETEILHGKEKKGKVRLREKKK